MDTNSRTPKLLGDFGEGLVSYALIRKGYEVASVDHVGADLIAQKESLRLAVSVKTRRYRARSTENRALGIDNDHLEKLEYFASRFVLEPIIAHAVCIDDDRTIHLFMLRATDVKKFLDPGRHGYRLRFSKKHLKQTIALPYVDTQAGVMKLPAVAFRQW